MSDGAVVAWFLICVAAGYLLQPTVLRAWRAVRSWRPRLAFSDTGIDVYWLSSLGAAYKTQEEALRHLQDEYAIARKDLRQAIHEYTWISEELGLSKNAPPARKLTGR